MKWRAASVVLRIDIQAELLEKVERGSCVALRSHVKQVQPVLVQSMNICMLFDQRVDGIQVALEAGEVDRSPALVVGLLVDPLTDLLFLQPLSPGILNQHVCHTFPPFKDGLVE